MKKIVVLICVFSIMIASVVPASASIMCDQVHYPIYFNGILSATGDKPILSLNWNTYVPLRNVCEGSGLEVIWNEQKQEIYVENVSALATQDYANLSQIYNNTADNSLYEIIYLNAFYEALDYLSEGQLSLYQTCLTVMQTYQDLIDINIDSSKIHMDSLYGYYDGDVVTKETYKNVEKCLKSDLIMWLSCSDLTSSLIEYANGNITYKKLSEALATFKENIEFARNSVSTPNTMATIIVYNTNNFSNYYYFDYQSIKPNLE